MQIDGRSVKNATKKLALHITPGDVTKGNTKDPGGCAAARACIREGHAKAARVHLGRTYLLIDNVWMRYNTPVSLRNEIVAFDRGGQFVPGDHILSPLPESQRSRTGHQGGIEPRGARQRRKKIARPYHVTQGVREKGANK